MFRYDVSADEKKSFENKLSSHMQKITSLSMDIERNELDILHTIQSLQKQKKIDPAAIAALSFELKQTFSKLNQKMKSGENGFESILTDLKNIIAKSAKKVEADVLFELGSNACLDKNYSESIKHFNRAYDLFCAQRDNNFRAIADVLQHIGMCHLKLKELRSAIGPLKDAHNYYKQTDRNAEVCTALMLGLTFYYLGDKQEAEKFFSETITFFCSLKEAEQIEKACQVTRHIMQDEMVSLTQSSTLTPNLEKIVQITAAFNKLNPPETKNRLLNRLIHSTQVTKKSASKLFRSIGFLEQDVRNLIEAKRQVVLLPYQAQLFKPLNKAKSLFFIPEAKEHQLENPRPASR